MMVQSPWLRLQMGSNSRRLACWEDSGNSLVVVLFCCDPREQAMIVIKFATILTRSRERQDEGRWLG